jgi:hypothetical protein
MKKYLPLFFTVCAILLLSSCANPHGITRSASANPHHNGQHFVYAYNSVAANTPNVAQ